MRADLRKGLPSQKVARFFQVLWLDKRQKTWELSRGCPVGARAGGRVTVPLAGDRRAAGTATDTGDGGERRNRSPDPAAASRDKATKRVPPAQPRRCRPGVPGQPGVTLLGCHLKVLGTERPVAESCGSPAPAGCSAHDLSRNGIRGRVPAPPPWPHAGWQPRRGSSPHAWPPPRRLALRAGTRPRQTCQTAERRAGAALGSGTGSRRIPSKARPSGGKTPCNAPEAEGGFRRTARRPAATSPGARQPKSGAPGPGGTIASSNKSSRKKLKAEGCSSP